MKKLRFGQVCDEIIIDSIKNKSVFLFIFGICYILLTILPIYWLLELNCRLATPAGKLNAVCGLPVPARFQPASSSEARKHVYTFHLVFGSRDKCR